MRLSAIIPTHDRPESLQQCLCTLQAQDIVPAHVLQVIVVDDGSAGDLEATVAAISADGPLAIRYERQQLSGLNAARNRGASEAAGDILAFLDDDTLVSPGWARALVRAFESQPCAAVGGKVELKLATSPPAWLATRRHFLAEYDLGPNARWITGDQWRGGDPVPVGANCAVRRSEFERMHGFHVGLDRLANSLVSNGDTEFFRRLRAAGGRLWYEPDACVTHCVPADRLTVRYFTRRHYAQGISDELLLTLEGESPTLRRRYRLARELGHAAKLLASDVCAGRGTVNAHLWASYWSGRLLAAGRLPPESKAADRMSA